MGLPTEWFFPAKSKRNLYDGRIICSSCDVKQECLDHSIETKIEFGIWGGEREYLRRRKIRDLRSGKVSREE